MTIIAADHRTKMIYWNQKVRGEPQCCGCCACCMLCVVGQFLGGGLHDGLISHQGYALTFEQRRLCTDAQHAQHHRFTCSAALRSPIRTAF